MKTNWYKEAVVYQIYPFSFMDSDNDGMGDIQGIISKLDYIRDLGVTAIWFSPLYVSPCKDYGYDVADYKAIDPKFGTMEDFDRLMAECKKRDLRVIMDMVLNHTSDQHEWFKAALADKNSPYRDYYIIRKGRLRKGKLIPPTNWTSSFTGSAWERIEGTDEYYLHLFAPAQPDLNWENPKVRDEIIDILKFWLDKGVSGFRFDVFNMYSKVYPLKDDKSRIRFQKGTPYFVDGPRMHEFLKEMNERALSLYDSYTVGESYIPDEAHTSRYVDEESGELDTIFDFEHLNSDNILKFMPKAFDLRKFKKGLIEPQMRHYGRGWNTLVLENHDGSRSVSRFGINTAEYRYEAATMLALVTFMGWGTPFIYQGEEIGMTNCRFRSIDEMKDPVTHFVHDMMTTQLHIPEKAAFRLILHGARDHARTPMQWDNSVNAGFNKGAEPWQCVNPDYYTINVRKDLASDRSIYRFYQKLLSIKKTDRTAIYGDTLEYDPDNRKVITYSRSYEGRRLLIVGNFSDKNAECIIPMDFALSDLNILLSNYDDPVKGRVIELRPYEAILFEENR
ncbi:MAG: alpha-glucosidase [Mogibacterium sp.]|nr:alpha-glucosidase [Mogibacterium sp.]